jgi:hypothetical protein
VAVHLGVVRVGGPPEVEPVGVYLQYYISMLLPRSNVCSYLVISYQDHPTWEIQLHPPIFRFLDLSSYGSIPTDPYRRRCPPLCQGRNKYAERLLSEGHIRIVQVSVKPVQRSTYELRGNDAR